MAGHLTWSFVLLFVVGGKISLSVGFTWINCTTPSCQSLFVYSQCNNSSCSCGVSTNKSTCNIEPNVITNRTAANLNASQGNLSCCWCPSNNTFCCKTCQSTSSISPTSTVQQQTATSAVPVTSSPADTAYLLAVFITDCTQYLSKKSQVASSFNHVIGNLTNTVIDVINITCSTGAQPYCGVDVSSLNILGKAVVGSVECSSMLITAKMKSSFSVLRKEVEKLRAWTQHGNLSVQLQDGSKIKLSFLISRFSNTSNTLHQGNLVIATTIPPITTVPPIVVNILPLVYAGIGVGSFLFLCIVYQCAKQSYYLRKKKFTTINSNRINSRKKKMEEAMENKHNNNKDEISQDQVGFDMTHNRLPVVDNDTLTRRYDWTTPGYLPSMLAPAYSDTHGQHSPPRLMLDDDDSDGERRSLGKSSVVNVDEESDDDLREILESEDEEDVRPNTRQSYISARNKSLSVSNNRKLSTASKTDKEKRLDSAVLREPSDVRKTSFGGPKDGNRSPRHSFGNIKSNRITPIDNTRKPSVSSLKPKKIVDSTC